MVKEAEDEEHAERNAKVDDGLNILGEQEHVLWHVNFGEDGRVGYERRHTLGGGLVEVREDQVAAKKVDGVVVDLVAEELGEDDLHDKQGEQGIKHTPKHAEHRTLVLGFEIARHQLLEEKLVLFKTLKHQIPRKFIQLEQSASYDNSI